MAQGLTQSNRNEYQESSWEVKGGADLTSTCEPICWKMFDP
jgi:hypothetical protein